MNFDNTNIERVFIIDDNVTDQYLVSRSTEQIFPGITTVKFPTAECFIKHLDHLIENELSSELRNTLVTMDLRMPGMGGLQALEEIQSRIDAGLLAPKIFPCFILTSSNSPQDRIKIDKFEFVREYIIKPITIEKLNNIMNK